MIAMYIFTVGKSNERYGKVGRSRSTQGKPQDKVRSPQTGNLETSAIIIQRKAKSASNLLCHINFSRRGVLDPQTSPLFPFTATH